MNEAAIKQNIQEDQRLVEAFQSGDKTAFDQLVIKYKDKIFNIAFRLLGDREEANDLAQDVFVKAYFALPRFRREAGFITWLYKIAVNTCKNKRASLWYKFRQTMLWLDRPKDDAEDMTSSDLSDESYAPEKVYEDSARAQKLQVAIDTLPAEQRKVFVLSELEDLPYAEIVRITGCNLGTVKSKIARAREKLKKILAEEVV